MQVVILAGGFGTRLSEETDHVPKPMVKIGMDPIIVHIMRYYSYFGHIEFVIAAGYKKDVIEDYFKSNSFSWNIKVVDTGLETSTGGRLLQLKNILKENFLLTYGDGLGNIDLYQLENHHNKAGGLITVTAVSPPARFGSLQLRNGLVTKFSEKNQKDSGWINGGFFYCNKGIISYIKDEIEPFENEPLRTLAEQNKMAGYKHYGWWQPMDTLRDKRVLQSLWDSGSPPWIK